MSPRGLTVAGLLLSASMVVPRSALAEEPARLGLTPASQPGEYFELRLEAGDRHAAEVEVANFGSEPAEARTYAADVYSIVNGGFGAELYGEAPVGTATWISYPTLELRLGPRETQRVAFVVAVPDGTPPGEYLAALVVESTGPIRTNGPLALRQVTRSVIAIAVTVPGPRQPSLAIGGVTHRTVAGRSILAFDIQNRGNVHLAPAGGFSLFAAERTPLEAAPVVMAAVYAQTSTLLEAPLRDPLPAGEYCAELSLTDSASGAHDETACLAFSVPAPQGSQVGEDGGNFILDPLPGTSLPVAVSSGIFAVLGLLLIGLGFLLAGRRSLRTSDPRPVPRARA